MKMKPQPSAAVPRFAGPAPRSDGSYTPFSRAAVNASCFLLDSAAACLNTVSTMSTIIPLPDEHPDSAHHEWTDMLRIMSLLSFPVAP